MVRFVFKRFLRGRRFEEVGPICFVQSNCPKFDKYLEDKGVDTFALGQLVYNYNGDFDELYNDVVVAESIGSLFCMSTDTDLLHGSKSIYNYIQSVKDNYEGGKICGVV